MNTGKIVLHGMDNNYGKISLPSGLVKKYCGKNMNRAHRQKERERKQKQRDGLHTSVTCTKTYADTNCLKDTTLPNTIVTAETRNNQQVFQSSPSDCDNVAVANSTKLPVTHDNLPVIQSSPSNCNNMAVVNSSILPDTHEILSGSPVHEYSFHGMNVDSVLHGEINIQILDYTSQMLKVQYMSDYGLLPPSYLYSCTQSRGTNVIRKIPREVKAVQMHYIPGHYVLSSQNKDKISVFDSLPSDDHKNQVLHQLQLLYEDFQEDKVEYTTPQHQGYSVLCGLYVIANAVFILNGKDPHGQNLLSERMRTHLHKCLLDGKMCLFPTSVFSPLLTSYFEDQKTQLCNHKETFLKPRQSGNIGSRTLKRQNPLYREHENELRRQKRANCEYRALENKKRRQSRSLKRKDKEFTQYENRKEKERKRIRRNDESYRLKENELRTENRRLKRKDKEFTQNENRKEKESRRKIRKDESYRLKENKMRTESRRLKRKDKEFTQNENRKEKESKRIRRNDESYRLKENEMITEKRRLKRKDKEFKQNENRKEKESRRKRRNDESYRLKENEMITEKRRLKRKDKEFTQNENRMEKESRHKRRNDESYRLKENELRTENRRLKRKDKEFTQNENRMEKESRRIRRNDESYRLKENELRTESRRLKRKDKEFTQNENRKEKESRHIRRKDESYRLKENELRTESRRLKRKDKEFTQNENRKEKESRCIRRNDESYRLKENKLRTESRRLKRKDKEFTQNENRKEKESRCIRRNDESHRIKENELRTERRRLKRKDKEFTQNENRKEKESRCKRRNDESYRLKENDMRTDRRSAKRSMSAFADTDKLIENFHKTVKSGPVIVCCLCKQLWYQHSVIKTKTVFKGVTLQERIAYVIRQKTSSLVPDSTNNQQGLDWICNTCATYVKKRKIPPCSYLNKMTFPYQGPLKQLNVLEQLLIAPILPFFRLHQASVGKQYRINGNVVLVPSDIQNTVSALPRLTSETATIKATLKRKLQYKHYQYSMNIRPDKIRESIAFLKASSLYRDLNIKLNENFDFDTEIDSDSGISDEENNATKCQTQSSDHNNKKDEAESDWSEDDNQTESSVSPGIQDTMLSAPDFVEPSEKDFIFNFAPGEGRQPVSVFLQPNAEELAFPSIFCGQTRPANEERIVPVSYSEIVKSELRNQDRRAASNIENIFFKTKKLQMKQIIDQTQVALRKSKTKGRNVTAKDVRGDSGKQFIYQDKAFRFMSAIRGSPSYFQSVSKDLFAMIRQLGPATFFCSLSAAETRWTHLLCILSKIVDDKQCTEDEAENFDWPTKCRLIQSDPVTCARHFDYSVNKFLKYFMFDKSYPVGEIKDYFYRVEYQQRGSPHVHMMIWCENSPQYGQDSTENVIDFIDTYITCEQPPNTDSCLTNLVKLQTHRHSHTCRKKHKKTCRFGFPKPPMEKTCILEPFTENDCNKTEKVQHSCNWKAIQDKLNDIHNKEEAVSFDQFLESLSLTRNQYFNAVRASIKTPTVFLKRTTSESRINGYNKDILKAWRANIDLQFVVDVYACASYIAAYVTKSHRGMSELLRTAANEARDGNLEVKQQVRSIGNKFLNAVEISAQEAVYICLGLPMRKSSRQVLFVNTSPPEERICLLKSVDELQKLDDDDEDIECSNILSRYSERPQNMDKLTLADFVSNYTKTKTYSKRPQKPSQISNEGLLPEPYVSDNEDSLSDQEQNKKKSTELYKKVKTPRILRYVHFNPETDEEKYYREQIMLFYPWRNEDLDLLRGSATFREHYDKIKEDIESQRTQYEPYRNQVDAAERNLNDDPDMQDIWDTVAPVTEDIDGTLDQSIPIVNEEDQYDIGPDLGIPTSSCQRESIAKTYELEDKEYRQHMRSLNKEQMEFVYNTIHDLKTSEEPVYRFLSGGAGCGKTHVLKALYQTAVKYYNSIPGVDFSCNPVLLMAPTGKAAYHIRGNTIHNAMKIPANQKLEYRSLQSSTLNTFRNQLCDVKLIFIDEISMVGFRMFNFIHQRLQELKQSKEDFGGVSIIVIGDLFQLKPVHDCYIFQQSHSSYMPLATSLWQEHFPMYELTQIMRQRECLDFALLLNRLREGKQTSDDIAELNKHIVNQNSDQYPLFAPHLFTTNDRVNQHNFSIIHQSPNPVHEVKATDRLVGTYSEEMKNKILSCFLTSSNEQLPSVVYLTEGCVYDLTVNLDTTDGLTNGATCTIMKVSGQNNKPADPVWVKFQDESAGKSLRTGAIMRNMDKSWTPLFPVSRQFQAGYKGQAQVQRLQYPLRAAAAKTVHRAQGDTVQNIVIDLTTKRKVDHIHYVALSRVSSTKGLNILTLQQDKISVNNHVINEMERLRQNKIVPSLTFLYTVTSPLKIAFLNARSLHHHIEDVRCDFNLNACDVIGFCETRFTTADKECDTAIERYYQNRQDSVNTARTRPSHGLALYTKQPVKTIKRSNLPVEILSTKINNIDIEFVYRPPSTSTSVLINSIREMLKIKCNNRIILGDFNIDQNKPSAQQIQLQELMEKNGYRQYINEPTTDSGSRLDLIYTNILSVETGVLEVYYSDHKAVWIAL